MAGVFLTGRLCKEAGMPIIPGSNQLTSQIGWSWKGDWKFEENILTEDVTSNKLFSYKFFTILDPTRTPRPRNTFDTHPGSDDEESPPAVIPTTAKGRRKSLLSSTSTAPSISTCPTTSSSSSSSAAAAEAQKQKSRSVSQSDLLSSSSDGASVPPVKHVSLSSQTSTSNRNDKSRDVVKSSADPTATVTVSSSENSPQSSPYFDHTDHTCVETKGGEGVKTLVTPHYNSNSNTNSNTNANTTNNLQSTPLAPKQTPRSSLTTPHIGPASKKNPKHLHNPYLKPPPPTCLSLDEDGNEIDNDDVDAAATPLVAVAVAPRFMPFGGMWKGNFVNNSRKAVAVIPCKAAEVLRSMSATSTNGMCSGSGNGGCSVRFKEGGDDAMDVEVNVSEGVEGESSSVPTASGSVSTPTPAPLLSTAATTSTSTEGSSTLTVAIPGSTPNTTITAPATPVSTAASTAITTVGKDKKKNAAEEDKVSERFVMFFLPVGKPSSSSMTSTSTSTSTDEKTPQTFRALGHGTNKYGPFTLRGTYTLDLPSSEGGSGNVGDGGILELKRTYMPRGSRLLGLELQVLNIYSDGNSTSSSTAGAAGGGKGGGNAVNTSSLSSSSAASISAGIGLGNDGEEGRWKNVTRERKRPQWEMNEEEEERDEHIRSMKKAEKASLKLRRDSEAEFIPGEDGEGGSLSGSVKGRRGRKSSDKRKNQPGPPRIRNRSKKGQLMASSMDDAGCMQVNSSLNEPLHLQSHSLSQASSSSNEDALNTCVSMSDNMLGDFDPLSVLELDGSLGLDMDLGEGDFFSFDADNTTDDDSVPLSRSCTPLPLDGESSSTSRVAISPATLKALSESPSAPSNPKKKKTILTLPLAVPLNQVFLPSPQLPSMPFHPLPKLPKTSTLSPFAPHSSDPALANYIPPPPPPPSMATWRSAFFYRGGVYEGDMMNGVRSGVGVFLFPEQSARMVLVGAGVVSAGEGGDGERGANGDGERGANGDLLNAPHSQHLSLSNSQSSSQSNSNNTDDNNQPLRNIYQGPFKKDKEHGYATLTDSRKRLIYRGEFERGKIQGRGCYYYDRPVFDGNTVDSGNSKTDDPSSSTAATSTSKTSGVSSTYYAGEFKENLRCGQGTYYFKNGDVYTGEWKDNVFSGKGKLTWSTGTYTGDWKCGRRDGRGKLCLSLCLSASSSGSEDEEEKCGFSYDGLWVADKMQGKGVAVYEDGMRFDGSFVDGKREGRGTITWDGGESDMAMSTTASVSSGVNHTLSTSLVGYTPPNNSSTNLSNNTTSSVGGVYEGRFRQDEIEGTGGGLVLTNTVRGRDEGEWIIPVLIADLSVIHLKAGFSGFGN